MTIDTTTILRLILSQAFALYFLLVLIPLKEPQKRNTMIIVLGAVLITLMNALLIIYIGITFYLRFYFLTLLLPYIFLFSYFVVHKGAKFIFGLLSIQVIGNVTIINGLYASQLFYGENNPLVDTVARVITYILFLPIVFKFIRPTYLRMVEMLDQGWWILNSALIASYALAYFILFVPDPIFYRPEYFIHGYIGIILSLFIYSIIFFLFIEIQLKTKTEKDKELLSIRVKSLAAQSEEITTIAYKDSLTGVKNRYSLYRQMDLLIENKQHFLVVFMDLDNLKEINDRFDHAKGDAYLMQFAVAVQLAINDQGEIYRFAGDEFICLITHDFNQFNINQFKYEIETEMNGDTPYHGVSIGLAYYPTDGQNADELISLADQAMYIEKRLKTNHR